MREQLAYRQASAERRRKAGNSEEPAEVRPGSRAKVRQQDNLMRDWAAPITDWIGRHPGVSLGLALGVGVMVGWLVKRR